MNCYFTLWVLAATFFCLLAASKVGRSDLLELGNGGIGSGKFWSDCTKPSDRHVQINYVTVTPTHPVKGDNVFINVSVTLDEELTGGSVMVSLMYGFLPIYKHTFDLCQLLQYVKKTCPLPKGTYEGAGNGTIPMDFPGGNYDVTAVATDQNNQEIHCITANYKF